MDKKKGTRPAVIKYHIHRRKIGTRNDQIAELVASAAGAAAPLCVVAADAALVALLAVLEADEESLATLLLLDIFLPLPLLDGEIAGEAVTATTCVGFHFEALPSDSDPEPEPPPRPLKIAPATPVTESGPTW